MSLRGAGRAEAQRLLAHFRAFGAAEVEAAILQPAAELLDLYGEDVRARAWVAQGEGGEMMLRPDFTVPVARAHMEAGLDPARYAYAGEVFRQGEPEHLQAGFEILGDREPARADAEVFWACATALPDLPLRAAMGDVGLLAAAIDGLPTTDGRRAALRRHLWRPARFRALLDRFAAPVPPRPPAPEPEAAGPAIGLRGVDEVRARLLALARDAEAPPLPPSEVARVEAILALRCPAPEALDGLRDLARGAPPLEAAVERLAARLDALARRGVALDRLAWEGSFGLTTLEYYDGFVFGLFAAHRPDLPPVAVGGRYDALTRVLGRGREVPAVGAALRPELAVALRAGA